MDQASARANINRAEPDADTAIFYLLTQAEQSIQTGDHASLAITAKELGGLTGAHRWLAGPSLLVGHALADRSDDLPAAFEIVKTAAPYARDAPALEPALGALLASAARTDDVALRLEGASIAATFSSDPHRRAQAVNLWLGNIEHDALSLEQRMESARNAVIPGSPLALWARIAWGKATGQLPLMRRIEEARKTASFAEDAEFEHHAMTLWLPGLAELVSSTDRIAASRQAMAGSRPGTRFHREAVTQWARQTGSPSRSATQKLDDAIAAAPSAPPGLALETVIGVILRHLDDESAALPQRVEAARIAANHAPLHATLEHQAAEWWSANIVRLDPEACVAAARLAAAEARPDSALEQNAPPLWSNAVDALAAPAPRLQAAAFAAEAPGGNAAFQLHAEEKLAGLQAAWIPSPAVRQYAAAFTARFAPRLQL